MMTDGEDVIAAATDNQRSVADMQAIQNGGLETVIDENYTFEQPGLYATPSTPVTTAGAPAPQQAEPATAPPMTDASQVFLNDKLGKVLEGMYSK